MIFNGDFFRTTDNGQEAIGQWSIRAQKNDADVDITGVVGDLGFFGESTSAADFMRTMRDVGRVSRLNVHVHSPGGSVFDGLAIYRTIRDFKTSPGGEKVVHVPALAASIASVIMLAGDRVEVSPDAKVMIHNPMGMTMGDAKEHQQAIDRLNAAKQTIVQIYQRRTGDSAEHLSDLMDQEHWFENGDEIKAAGFADTVKEDKALSRIAAMSPAIMAILKGYKSTPQDIYKRGPAPVSPEIAARLAKLGVK